MNYSSNVILAIAPGKRELGIAVFSGVELTYVSVKTITHRQSKKYPFKEITDILQSLFQNFSIKAVVVKAVSQYQKLSPDIEKIVEHIKSQPNLRDLPVTDISIEQIKSVLCKNEKPTQKRAFKTILDSYPELKMYWNRPNKWQNDYYAFLFSAVAVGVVYLKTSSEND